jgi:integrase/recombinase XerD
VVRILARAEAPATVADVQKALAAAVAVGLQVGGGGAPVGPGRPGRGPSLASLVDQWRVYLVQVEHDGAAHAAAVSRMVSRVAGDCRATTPADLDETRVGEWFAAAARMKGREGHVGLSANTRNHYLAALKAFLNWCRRRGHLAANPLQDFKRWNAKTDERHKRRALTPAEVSKLLAAAASGPVVETIGGRDRAVLYLVACWTGLRKSELGSLTADSFVDLAGDSPTVHVAAAFTKNKEAAAVPLHPAVASIVVEWLKRRRGPPGALLWPISARSGGVTRKTHKMLRRDLAAAGVPYRTAAGVADFHATRHTFVTALGRAGVDVGVRQRLARHSDVKLTLGIYTHVVDDERRAAVRALSAPIVNPLESLDGSTDKRRRRRKR